MGKTLPTVSRPMAAAPSLGAMSALRRRRGVAGFSMVEVVVAIFVVTIGVSALIPMLVFNIKSNSMANFVSVANFLAEAHLEQVRSWPYYESVTVDGTNHPGIVSTNTELFGTFNNVTMPGTNMEFDVTVELYHNGYTQDCSGVLFGSSGGSVNVNDSILNSGSIQGDCTTGVRGEDFKIIRATVNWTDRFGAQEIQRHAYISRF
ncbi:MAG: hypothetical protein H6684_06095 [Deltaproteobacteria bacterium]|nr:hypothetical protein [bacterium]MCB9477302.1 hypothetical protein [Deltaproteobacteria bacterium]MCB9478768.1 hypothetical protein [Deltaproteobacteria bacterium]MCB9488284.1 hypothetical protein [Deltaproteobacteria bacterium]